MTPPVDPTALIDELCESLRSGYLFGHRDEPLDAYGRRLVRVIELRLRALASPATPATEGPHRCSGCGHRWHGGPAAQNEWTGAELCGDCWRKAQPVLHASPAAGQGHAATPAGLVEERPGLYSQPHSTSIFAPPLALDRLRGGVESAPLDDPTPRYYSVSPPAALDREALVKDIEAIRRMYGHVTVYDERPTYEVGDVLDAIVSALAALPAAPAPEGQLPSPKLHHVCVDGKVKPFSLDICANCYWANRADVEGQTHPGAR